LPIFRKTWRAKEPTWFNSPVPSFGPLGARLLIVGLAPGLQGANRTGRPFTGDYAGVLLYETLKKYGFARGDYGAHPDDGLELVDCRITNVRALRPAGKQADAARNQDVPRFSHPDHRRDEEAARHRCARPDRA
jgi:uracil-DNA glycosylase